MKKLLTILTAFSLMTGNVSVLAEEPSQNENTESEEIVLNEDSNDDDTGEQKSSEENIVQPESSEESLSETEDDPEVSEEQETVTVTFDKNAEDAYGEMDPQSFTVGESNTLIANEFARDGYEFTSWNTESDGSGDTYTDGQIVTFNESQTLYAQWSQIVALEEHPLLSDSDSYSDTETDKSYFDYTINSDNTVTINKFNGQLSKYIVPQYIDDCPVTAIAKEACKGHEYVESVVLPSTITSIGYSAFQSCKLLETINIPEGVTSIKYYLFRSCKNLTNISLPDSITTIETYAFSGTGITELTLPESVMTIGKNVFYGTLLQKIHLGSSLVNVDMDALYLTTLKDIYYAGSEAEWEKLNIGVQETTTVHFGRESLESVEIREGDSIAIDLSTTDKATLHAVMLPESAASLYTVSWSSSDESICKIDQDGNIRALSTGQVTITAAAGSVSYECFITVYRYDEQHKDDGFNLWPTDGSFPEQNGKYYLGSNVTSRIDKAEWTVPDGDTTICLNGYEMLSETGNSFRIIIPKNSNLIIEDCSESQTGYLRFNRLINTSTGAGYEIVKSAITVEKGGTLTVNSGNIGNEGGRNYFSSRLIELTGGSVVINGGHITHSSCVNYPNNKITAIGGDGDIVQNNGIIEIKMTELDADYTQIGYGISVNGNVSISGGSILFSKLAGLDGYESRYKYPISLTGGHLYLCGDQNYDGYISIGSLSEAISAKNGNKYYSGKAKVLVTSPTTISPIIDGIVDDYNDDSFSVYKYQSYAFSAVPFFVYDGKIYKGDGSKKSIELDRSRIILLTDSEKVNVTVKDWKNDVIDYPVTWVSSNEEVATVDQSGVVTRVSEGNAVITATIQGTEISATCNVTVSNNHEHDGIIFLPWEKTDSLPTDGGNYYLVNDVEMSTEWDLKSGTKETYAETCLCLNGKTIRCTNENGLVSVGMYEVLRIFDEDNKGKIILASSSDESLIGIGNDWSSLEINGGMFLNESTTKTGTGIGLAYSNAIMNGGEIRGFQYGVKLSGGNMLNHPVFTLNNGTIVDNQYGIYTETGSFGSATIYLRGGLVTDNKRGGVYTSGNTKITLSNNPMIYGNTDYRNLPYNLISHGSLVKVDGQLTSGKEKIGFYAQSSGKYPYTFTDGLSGNGSYDTFFSDYSNSMITDIDGEAALCKVENTIKLYCNSETENVRTYTSPGATIPEKPADPTRAGYTFAGWFLDEDLTEEYMFDTKIYTNLTLYAKWTENLYTITWIDSDGITVLDQRENVKYGNPVKYKGVTPTKEQTDQYTYEFIGWNTKLDGSGETMSETVTDSVTYYAQFNPVLHEYAVTWKNEDEILATEDYKYGDNPEYKGEAPQKTKDVQYTYVFDHWEDEATKKPLTDETKVLNNTVFVAIYTSEINQYTVSWVNEDGTKLYESTVDYGKLPQYKGETPEKVSDAQYDYEFDQWTPEITQVTGNATYTATYTVKDRYYTVTWKNGDATLQSEELKYGTLPEYKGDTPVKASDDQYHYVFDGFTPEVETVSGPAIYTANYLSKLRVKEISLNKTSISLFDNGFDNSLIATILPEGADNKKIIWDSSDTSIATVDQDGKVTGVSAGTAVISVETEDGKLKAECNVTVKDSTKTSLTINVESLSTNSSIVALYDAQTSDTDTKTKILNNAEDAIAVATRTEASSNNTVQYLFEDVLITTYKLAVYKNGYIVSIAPLEISQGMEAQNITLRAFGDVDNNNAIDVSDIIKIRDIILGEKKTIADLTDDDRSAADVNNDGSVDVSDIILVRDRILGVVDEEYKKKS